jgi:hypothetical protein
MNRILPPTIFTFLVCLMLASGASATTYYIAANGSDANNGTSKTTSWQHAPGMPNCTGTCASTTPKPGDQFIFRGGDTWHYGSGTPSVGGSWNWNWSGTSAHCNYDANDTSTCTYIGVDQTWFGGSSWTRPVLTGDNPLSSVLVSNCRNDNTSTSFFSANGNSYLIFDNFEITGYCWSGTGMKGNVTIPGASYTNFINMYVHGWSSTIGSTDDKHIVGYGPNFGSANHNVWAFDIFDGSDALNGTTTASNQCPGVLGPPCRSGYPFGGESYDVHDSVFNNVSQSMITSQLYTFHDNIVENLYATYDGVTHPNGIESNSGQPSGLPMYIYNNIFFQIQESAGVGMWPEPVAPMYFFNNVEWHVNPGNCYMYDKPSAGTPATAVYFHNNTTDAPCQFLMETAHTPPTGTATFANNHLIGYSSLSGFINNSSTVTVADNGGHVFQSESAANNQGYLPTNFYAPTAGTNATVGAGNNRTSFCTSIADATVATACQSAIGGITYNTSNHTLTANTPNARPSSGAWDAGAYEFNAADQPPNPPTGLSAVVQ